MNLRLIPRAYALVLTVFTLLAASADAATYYISSATGCDADSGLTPADAFATVAHVSTLTLGPGDEVRFLCGETWRADPLIVTRSGSAGSPIVFSSHPASTSRSFPEPSRSRGGVVPDMASWL